MSKEKIPKGWGIFKVKDIFDRVRNPVEVIKDEKYTQIGIRSHGKGIFYKEAVTGEQLGNKSVFWVEPDCFIVNIVFAWEMAVARTTDKDRGYIASHRFPMYRPKKGVLDLDFITYLFKSPRGKYLLNLASPGGAGRNKTLGQKEFEEVEILLPTDIKEQKKIASVLITSDKLIKGKEELIKPVEKQMNGLMQKLLRGEIRLPGFRDEWTKEKLGNVARVIMGQSPNSDSYNDSKEGIPLIQGNADIKNRRTIPRTWTTTPTKICMPGDILMTVRAPVGSIAFSEHEACIGRGVCAIKGTINQDYLYYQLIRKENMWGKIAQGSTFEAVNSNDIKELIINVPPEEEQIAISKVLQVFDRNLSLLYKELEELNNQKKALMQQLLTGKTRIKV
ncbi:restriction endonuclease subunit S [Lysinibacillus sp. G4S2]|uniref:restriction endonuclease subunit S n=1 Tax=Lysinibacillus sp. G4S2 TaxID=3055859 RepID=UPI0025A0397C|nr:restriction endonuclease subunit S [Lysinibacillus sp. G4S2]MDM5250097.1 restriction endonuclease subunit S [Lysinibacillus sp. G4S2]